MFFITHIDKFFHNSPGAEMCLGTPHFIGQNYSRKFIEKSVMIQKTFLRFHSKEKDSKCGMIFYNNI